MTVSREIKAVLMETREMFNQSGRGLGLIWASERRGRCAAAVWSDWSDGGEIDFERVET